MEHSGGNRYSKPPRPAWRGRGDVDRGSFEVGSETLRQTFRGKPKRHYPVVAVNYAIGNRMMGNKSIVVSAGFLALAFGILAGCGGGTMKPGTYASAQIPDAGNATTNSSMNTLWHGCKSTQNGVTVSCTETADITGASSCQGSVYVDSCPTIDLVAKCNILDKYMKVVRINYEYSGTLQDAQQYTIVNSGETASCTAP